MFKGGRMSCCGVYGVPKLRVRWHAFSCMDNTVSFGCFGDDISQSRFLQTLGLSARSLLVRSRHLLQYCQNRCSMLIPALYEKAQAPG